MFSRTLLFAATALSVRGFAPMRAGAARAVSVSAAFSIDEAVAASDVVVFSKTTCPFCAKTKALFAELKVEPSYVELNKREDGGLIQKALAEKTGQRTVPSVFIKGKHLGGNDDTQKAAKEGTLQKMLGI